MFSVFSLATCFMYARHIPITTKMLVGVLIQRAMHVKLEFGHSDVPPCKQNVREERTR